MTAQFTFAPSDDPIVPYGKVKPQYVFPDKVAHRLVRGASAAIMLTVCVGAGIGFFVSERRASDDRVTASRVSSSGLPVERHIARKEISFNPRQALTDPLLAPSVDYTQTFSGLPTHPPDLCQALADAGFGTSPWQRSPWDQSTWECVSETAVESTEPSTAPGLKSSLFFVFRGSAADRVTSLRVKLNLAPGVGNDAVLGAARRLFDALDAFKDLDVPVSVADGVIHLQPILMTTSLGSYRFSAERGDPSRFNLVVAYQPGKAGLLETTGEALRRDKPGELQTLRTLSARDPAGTLRKTNKPAIQ